MSPLYIYNAQVIDVHDGDTVRCNVDLGFSIFAEMTFRLYGINTPELYGPDKIKALEAKRFVIDLILDKFVVIKTLKDKKEKYGRYLAIIEYKGVSVNQQLVDAGLAVIYML